MKISFVGDEVSNIIKESIEIVLQNQQYHQKKVRKNNTGLSTRTHTHRRSELTVVFFLPLSPSVFEIGPAGEPVEQPRCRERHEEADRDEHSIQVHCHLRHHAEERRWPPHRCQLLLGQLYRREQDREVGKQAFVLHHDGLRPCTLEHSSKTAKQV